jgi:hypothetical protein
MAEVIQDTQQDFWRPPVTVTVPEPTSVATAATLAEACSGCGTEFMIGSLFCYACGRGRPQIEGAAKTEVEASASPWTQQVAWAKSFAGRLSWPKVVFPAWLRYLEFHEIKRWVGLPTASLVAFFVGMGCVVAALGVGFITARTFVDWQAIQFYRGEWLLGATAAFVAGILLKKSSKHHEE